MRKYKVGQIFMGCQNGLPEGRTFEFEIINVHEDGQISFKYEYIDSSFTHIWKTSEDRIDAYISAYELKNSPLGKALS